MSRFSRLLTATALILTFAAGGKAFAEPPPHSTAPASEPLWFEPPPSAPARVIKRTARPRVRISAKKSRYGKISLESLASRERSKPAVDCTASCAERQLKRKRSAPKREKRVSDLDRAVQLYR